MNSYTQCLNHWYPLSWTRNRSHLSSKHQGSAMFSSKILNQKICACLASVLSKPNEWQWTTPSRINAHQQNAKSSFNLPDSWCLACDWCLKIMMGTRRYVLPFPWKLKRLVAKRTWKKPYWPEEWLCRKGCRAQGGRHQWRAAIASSLSYVQLLWDMCGKVCHR